MGLVVFFKTILDFLLMRLALPVDDALVLDVYAEHFPISFDDAFQKSERAVAVGKARGIFQARSCFRVRTL